MSDPALMGPALPPKFQKDDESDEEPREWFWKYCNTFACHNGRYARLLAL